MTVGKRCAGWRDAGGIRGEMRCDRTPENAREVVEMTCKGFEWPRLVKFRALADAARLRAIGEACALHLVGAPLDWRRCSREHEASSMRAGWRNWLADR